MDKKGGLSWEGLFNIFYHLSESEIWPDNRGGAWWEWCYTRGTTIQVWLQICQVWSLTWRRDIENVVWDDKCKIYDMIHKLGQFVHPYLKLTLVYSSSSSRSICCWGGHPSTYLINIQWISSERGGDATLHKLCCV